MAYVHKAHSPVANQEAVLNGSMNTHGIYSLQGSARRDHAQHPSPMFSHAPLSWKRLDCILYKLHLISTHLGAGCDPPWGPEEPVDTCPACSLWLIAIIKRSISLEDCSCFRHPSFQSCHSKDGPPSHLPQIAKRACIQESHRTVANKEAVFKWA